MTLQNKMTKYLSLLILIFPIVVFSQTSPTTPVSTPAPVPARTPAPTPQPIATPVYSQRGMVTAEQRILLEEQQKREEQRKIARQMIENLYRKPSKKELLVVAVNSSLLEKYAVFLKQENTGIIKLLNNKCDENSKVISASENCLNNTMPGAGAAYSFRQENYRTSNLADIKLVDNLFSISGKWIHGLFVEIGDISLDKVSLETAGNQYLINFQPALEYESAKEIDFNLVKGIKKDGFIYSRAVAINENTTYLLRSIAYRGEVVKSVQGFVYNELDYDKRKDIIIAFRVVQRDLDGSVTILWKRLLIKDSPKIQFPSKLPDSKIKDNTLCATLI